MIDRGELMFIVAGATFLLYLARIHLYNEARLDQALGKPQDLGGAALYIWVERGIALCLNIFWIFFLLEEMFLFVPLFGYFALHFMIANHKRTNSFLRTLHAIDNIKRIEAEIQEKEAHIEANNARIRQIEREKELVEQEIARIEAQEADIERRIEELKGDDN